MRVLVFATAFEPAVRAGGPARSITNLARDASTRHDVIVVAPDRDLGENEPFPGLTGRTLTRGNAKVFYLNQSSPRQWGTLLKELAGQRFDLILLNSIWHTKLAFLPAMLKGTGVLKGPLVLMPRGELEPGALALKSRKKQMGGPAARALYRRTVAAFGSTSESEARSLNEWFPGTPVLMTSNISETMAFGTPEKQSETLRVEHLGRVHPTKGLLPLLRGLSGATGSIHVAAHGPMESASYWDACQAAASALPDNVTFEYGGMAERAQIPHFLWNSDCLILLTAGENYGHVIAEALQAGCPVITTPTTPWTDALRAGGGDIVEDREDPAEVAAVLDRWSAKSPTELAGARHRAREAFESFSAQSSPGIVELALAALAASK